MPEFNLEERRQEALYHLENAAFNYMHQMTTARKDIDASITYAKNGRRVPYSDGPLSPTQASALMQAHHAVEAAIVTCRALGVEAEKIDAAYKQGMNR